MGRTNQIQSDSVQATSAPILSGCVRTSGQTVRTKLVLLKNPSSKQRRTERPGVRPDVLSGRPDMSGQDHCLKQFRLGFRATRSGRHCSPCPDVRTGPGMRAVELRFSSFENLQIWTYRTCLKLRKTYFKYTRKLSKHVLNTN